MLLYRTSDFVAILLLVSSAFGQLSFDDYKRIHVDLNGNNKIPEDTLLRFFDASTKFLIQGLLLGHRISMGTFDECIKQDDHGFAGKYCVGTVTIKDINDALPFVSNSSALYNKNIQNIHNINKFSYNEAMMEEQLNFGLCVNSDVSADQLTNIFADVKMSYSEDHCYSKYSRGELPTKVIVVITILLIFVGIAIVSTIYDVIREQLNKEPIHEITIAFSMYTNGKKLIQSSKNPNQLLCINGLKSLNMLWVLSGHTYATSTDPIFYNGVEISEFIFKYSSMLVIGASVSVDSFLTITGILTVYTLLRSPDPGLKDSIKGIPMLYLHRYIRLTPALGIVILLYSTSTLDYIGNGPFWYHVHEYFVPNCENYWWSVLLYLQNYINPYQMCLSQSWYLSIDMQLFILSPLVLIPLRKWANKTLLAMYGLVALGIVVPFTITYLYDLPSMLNTVNPDFGPLYYNVLHTRFGPYVIGMIAGYFIFQAKNSKKPLKLNTVLCIVLWIALFGGLYAIVYAPFPLVKSVDDEIWWNSIYNGFARNLWGLLISLVVYLCVTGNGGPVNWFLSLPIMQLIAKLSYSIYLIHLIVIAIHYYAMRTELHFSTYEMMLFISSTFLTCMLLATLLSLIFESPMIVLEKIIFKRGKPKVNIKKTVSEP